MSSPLVRFLVYTMIVRFVNEKLYIWGACLRPRAARLNNEEGGGGNPRIKNVSSAAEEERVQGVRVTLKKVKAVKVKVKMV